MKIFPLLLLLVLFAPLILCNENDDSNLRANYKDGEKRHKTYRGRIKFGGVVNGDDDNDDEGKQDDNDDNNKDDDKNNKHDNNDGGNDNDDGGDDNDDDGDDNDDGGDDSGNKQHYRLRGKVLVRIKVPSRTLSRNQLLATIGTKVSAEQSIGGDSVEYKPVKTNGHTGAIATGIVGVIAPVQGSSQAQYTGAALGNDGSAYGNGGAASGYGDDASSNGGVASNNGGAYGNGDATSANGGAVSVGQIGISSNGNGGSTLGQIGGVTSVQIGVVAPLQVAVSSTPTSYQPTRLFPKPSGSSAAAAEHTPTASVTLVAGSAVTPHPPLRVTTAPGATPSPFRASPIKAYAGSHVRPIQEILQEIQFTTSKPKPPNKVSVAQHSFRPFRPKPIPEPQTSTKVLSDFESSKISGTVQPIAAAPIQQVKIVPVVKVIQPVVKVYQTPVQPTPAPKQHIYVTPAPKQHIYVTPAPKQHVYVTPAPKQHVYVTPAPKQHVYVTPAPKQHIYVTPAPKQYVYVTPATTFIQAVRPVASHGSTFGAKIPIASVVTSRPAVIEYPKVIQTVQSTVRPGVINIPTVYIQKPAQKPVLPLPPKPSIITIQHPKPTPKPPKVEVPVAPTPKPTIIDIDVRLQPSKPTGVYVQQPHVTYYPVSTPRPAPTVVTIQHPKPTSKPVQIPEYPVPAPPKPVIVQPPQIPQYVYIPVSTPRPAPSVVHIDYPKPAPAVEVSVPAPPQPSVVQVEQSKPSILTIQHPKPTPKPTVVHIPYAPAPKPPHSSSVVYFQMSTPQPTPSVVTIHHHKPEPKPAVVQTPAPRPVHAHPSQIPQVVYIPVTTLRPSFTHVYRPPTPSKPTILTIKHPKPTPKPPVIDIRVTPQKPSISYLPAPQPPKPAVVHVQPPSAPQFVYVPVSTPRPAPTLVTIRHPKPTPKPQVVHIPQPPLPSVTQVTPPQPPHKLHLYPKPSIIHIKHPRPTEIPVIDVAKPPRVNIPVAPQPPRPSVAHVPIHVFQQIQPVFQYPVLPPQSPTIPISTSEIVGTQSHVVSAVEKPQSAHKPSPPQKPVLISVSVDHTTKSPISTASVRPVVISPSQPLPPLRPVPTAPPADTQVEHHPPKGVQQPSYSQYFFETFLSALAPPVAPFTPPSTRKEVLSEVDPPKPKPGPPSKPRPGLPQQHHHHQRPLINLIPVVAVSTVRPVVQPVYKPVPTQPAVTAPLNGYVINNYGPHVMTPAPPAPVTHKEVLPQVDIAQPKPITTGQQYFVSIPYITQHYAPTKHSKPEPPPKKEPLPVIPEGRPVFEPISVTIRPVVQTIYHPKPAPKEKEVNYGQKTHVVHHDGHKKEKDDETQKVSPAVESHHKSHHPQVYIQQWPTVQFVQFPFSAVGIAPSKDPHYTTSAVLPQYDQQKPDKDEDEEDDDKKSDDNDNDQEDDHDDDKKGGSDNEDKKSGEDDGGNGQRNEENPQPPRPEFFHRPQQQMPQFIPQQSPQPTFQASQPDFQVPQSAFQAPQPTFQPPQPAFQAPQPAFQAPQPAFQPPQLDIRQFAPVFQPPNFPLSTNTRFLQPKPTINSDHHPNAHMKSSEIQRLRHPQFPPLFPKQFNVPTQNLMRNIGDFHRN